MEMEDQRLERASAPASRMPNALQQQCEVALPDREPEQDEIISTTPESRALTHELEKLLLQFNTAARQMMMATNAVQDPLEVLIQAWEELLTRPLNASSSIA